MIFHNLSSVYLIVCGDVCLIMCGGMRCLIDYV